MKERPVGTSPDFVDDTGLEINVERAGHMFTLSGFGEECRESVVVGGGRAFLESTVRLRKGRQGYKRVARRGKAKPSTHAETMLESVELPCDTEKMIVRLISISRYVYVLIIQRELELRLTASISNLNTCLTNVN